MGITQKIYSLDVYFKMVKDGKMIVNDFRPNDKNDLATVNNTLMTVYNTDTIPTIPTCECGELKGRYNIDIVCADCGTVCKDAHSKVEPVLWLENFNNIKFLNPDLWLITTTLFEKKCDKDRDYLRWLCSSSYFIPEDKIPIHIYGIYELLGKRRSYTNTMNRMVDILTYLLDHAKYKGKKQHIKMLIEMWKDKNTIFSKHIPIINKKLFVIEDTPKGVFTNLATASVIDIVYSWIDAVHDTKSTPIKNENATAAIISKLAHMYNEYFLTYIVKKAGMFRKHVYGARSPHTFRAVITSISGKHHYSEVHIPWAIAVTVLRPQLVSKLLKRNLKYKKINRMLFDAVNKYMPLVHEILNELITESPYRLGIPIIIQRNLT